MIIYNKTRPATTKVGKEICQACYTSRNYRLADIDKVYEKEKGLRELLDHSPIVNFHKRILIDIKVQNLEAKEYTTANKGWHLDGKLYQKPETINDNIYHLMCWGGAPTVFIDEYILTECCRNKKQQELANDLNLNKKKNFKVDPYVFYTYREHHWHKCGKAVKECTRTFIRIVESDYIKAQKI